MPNNQKDDGRSTSSNQNGPPAGQGRAGTPLGLNGSSKGLNGPPGRPDDAVKFPGNGRGADGPPRTLSDAGLDPDHEAILDNTEENQGLFETLLNNMTARIKELEAQLGQRTKDLEAQLSQRTKELERKEAQLKSYKKSYNDRLKTVNSKMDKSIDDRRSWLDASKKRGAA